MDNDANLLNRRNTIAVEQSLKDLSEKIYDQRTLITNLTNTVAMLTQRLSDVEQACNLLKAMTTLRGPTVRE